MILLVLIAALLLGIGLVIYGYLREVQHKTIENLPLMLRDHLR